MENTPQTGYPNERANCRNKGERFLTVAARIGVRVKVRSFGEAVTDSPDGVNVSGRLRIVFQLLPQPGYVYIDGSG